MEWIQKGGVYQGWQNWTWPANSTQYNTKLIDYGLRLNEFVLYSGWYDWPV